MASPRSCRPPLTLIPGWRSAEQPTASAALHYLMSGLVEYGAPTVAGASGEPVVTVNFPAILIENRTLRRAATRERGAAATTVVAHLDPEGGKPGGRWRPR